MKFQYCIGSVCTTRKQTGVGYPQVSAVMESADAAHGLKGHVISVRKLELAIIYTATKLAYICVIYHQVTLIFSLFVSGNFIWTISEPSLKT